MSVNTEHDKCVLWISVLKCIYMCQSLNRSYNIVQYGCSFDWILQWHSIWSVELNEEISIEMRNNRYIALVFEFDDTFSHHLKPNFCQFYNIFGLLNTTQSMGRKCHCDTQSTAFPYCTTLYQIVEETKSWVFMSSHKISLNRFKVNRESVK